MFNNTKPFEFLIITHSSHKFQNERLFAYGPYVREMNIWLANYSSILIIAPVSDAEIKDIELNYEKKVVFREIPSIEFTSLTSCFTSIWRLPEIMIILYKGIRQSEHIHLRCPGNIGLLGTVIQAFFPRKKKTAKYAGNWDWNSKQPWSYRIQQHLLRNTWITQNMQVLVYGNWNETKNIRPFFTASYSKAEIDDTPIRVLGKNEVLRLLYVGGLHKGKRPFMCLEVAQKLKANGLKIEMHFYGDGEEREKMEEWIRQNNLTDEVFLHGNVDAEAVKKAYQRAHFLVLISKSEGWPKVVAESMFWGCLPITTEVSCVPEMLDYGNRGDLVGEDVSNIVHRIEYYVDNLEQYQLKCEQAMDWSRQYTLEKFDSEIKQLIK